MKRYATIAAIGVALAMLSGCATQSTQPGASNDREPVHISWTASVAVASGEMNATLADGRQFSGSFVQMASDRLVAPGRIWVGWRYAWRDSSWDGFGAAPSLEMIHRGEVVANLKGPRGERMRCRFTLSNQDAGMAGGGRGACQLAEGGTVEAIFPRI